MIKPIQFNEEHSPRLDDTVFCVKLRHNRRPAEARRSENCGGGVRYRATPHLDEAIPQSTFIPQSYPNTSLQCSYRWSK